MPASAFGQAPEVSPFSMQAAEQVNPMMQEQSLAVTPQAPNNARIGSGMDMTQENPDFGAMLSSSGIPDSNVSSLVPGIENIKNPGAFDPPEPALKNALLGMLERADAREAQGLPRQDAPGIIDAPSGSSAETQGQQGTPNVDQVLQDGAGSFQPGGVDFSKPSTIKPPTMPEAPKLGPELEIRRGEEGSPQGYFNAITDERPLTPEEIKSGKAFADRKGFDFNPQTGFSVIDNPGARVFDTPATLENFQARGLDVGQFMRYEDDPSQRTEQFVDDQGRLRRRLTRDAATLQGFSPERIDQDRPLAPKFAQAEATGDQMIADLRAKEAAKAERRNKPPRSALRYIAAANERGATRADKARGMKAATKYNLDLRTGQPLPEAPQGLTFEQQLAQDKFEFDKQQSLTGDDTSDDATTRKIATIKQANPNISDADAAAIASGSVRVVTNDLTGVTQLLNIATGESRQIESQVAPDVNFDVAVPEQTLFSRAGDFTGFVEATKRKAQNITGQVGLDVATKESLEAAQDFETAQNELVRAFRESSRYAASEAAALKKELDISLSPFKDAKSAEAKLRSIDKSLARRYENEVATFRDTTFPPSDRQDARMRAKAIAEFRANLGVPPEGQGSTSSTQGKVPQGVDPKDWEFMSPEQRNLFN